MAQAHLQKAVEQALGEYFAAHEGELPPAGLYERILHEVELPLIRQTLRATGGNQCRAAEVLGINRNTLRKKMQVLGLTSDTTGC